MDRDNREMDSGHSVSQYIDGLRVGESVATRQIWERFFRRLIALADKRLRANRKAMDEEDVVQQAFAQFFRQVQEGRFPKLDDRYDLWQVLAMLVDRRAKDQNRRQRNQKAGSGKVRTESIFMEAGKSDMVGIAGVPDLQPTPQLATEMTELFRQRIASLKDNEYRQIALLKMQGHTNREIADTLQTSLRTVERRLDQIRTQWSSDTGS